MSGIHQTLIFAGTPGPFVRTFPPDGTSDITVIHGTASLDAFGRLQLPNNLGDSSFAYFNSMPATITDFDETMTTTIPSSQAMGLLGAASFTATTMDNGYRFDVLGGGAFRLFRYDATVLTRIHADVSVAGYYATAGNPAIFHFTRVGNVLDAWLSATGQPDSTHIGATDATYGAGRCGMLSFSIGTPLPIDRYSCIF